MKPKIIFLVGPTAIGKTEAAAILAKKLNAEIISCDSMQVYKEMDILTSKPLPALRRKIRHHLIDILSPTREYNVAVYRKDALKKTRGVIKRAKLPLFVGGTGLYMTILIDGIFEARAQDENIRDKFYKQAELRGAGYLYRRLKQIDPNAAKKIHPHDTKRIIRALEVFEITGKRICELQKQRKGLSHNYDVVIFGLNMPREKLYKRIDERVEKMFKRGLVSEVKELLKIKLSKTSRYAIGIKELQGYFDGLYDLEEAKRLIKRNTRLYAKRQLTWFRKDKRIKWIEIDDIEKPAQIAKRIFDILNKN